MYVLKDLSMTELNVLSGKIGSLWKMVAKLSNLSILFQNDNLAK